MNSIIASTAFSNYDWPELILEHKIRLRIVLRFHSELNLINGTRTLNPFCSGLGKEP